MSSLPDRKRPRLTQPVRSIASSLVRLASRGTWRVLHPSTRGSFTDGPRPEPLPRLYYEAGDGWRAPLLAMDRVPGAPGEPVLLAHGLGLGADALRYGAGPTLAGSLRDAGFAVYLWTHRADGAAIPPSARARAEVDFDHILERDLPAAVERIAEHSGHPRLHFVGQGLGGQLGLCWAAGRPDALGALVSIAAPVRFSASSAHQRLTRALRLLPSRWRLPLRASARLVTPFLDDGDLGPVAGDQRSVGGRVRGCLAHSSDDVPVRLLRQVLQWHELGYLASADGGLDWAEALRHATGDLLVVCGEADELCPPGAASAAADRWGGRADVHAVPGHGHLDLLFGTKAETEVFRPIVHWLMERRRNTWLDASTEAVYARRVQ